MADKKMSATMSTQIALDMVQASESIKSMTALVNANTSQWKAQEAQLKSVGDYLGAAKAKYDGLTKSISSQQAKIDALKEKQSQLKGNTEETARAYLNYDKQIAQAETKLASMTAQQTRAKESVEVQKSGIIELNNAYKLQMSVLESNVTKLKAQGNEYKALKTEQSGLKESLTNLIERENKQKELLSSMDSGSDAYKKQEIRVNELGTKIAETNTKIKSINEDLKKTPSHGLFGGIINQLKDTSAQEEKTKEKMSQFKEHIKSIVSGAAIYQGLQSIAGSLKGVAENGYEAAESAVTVKERMEGIGLSEKDIGSLTTQIKQLKENTNMSADSVNKLQMRFYDNTHSIEKAKELTQGVASLQDQLKLSSSQSDNFSTALNRIETSGTVTLSSLGKLEKSAPGFSTAFQKASGMSTDAFDKLVNSGKMTNDQFNDILSKASASYKKNSDTFNTTSGGALHKLTQTWKDTQQSLMTPLVDVSATGLSALSKALDNKNTQNAINKLGQGIAQLSQKAVKLIDYLVAHSKDIESIGESVLSIAGTIGKGVWSVFSGTIKTIGVMFGSMGDKAFKSKDPLDQLSSAFKAIASHKTAIEDITKILVGTLLTSRAINDVKMLKASFDNLVGGIQKVGGALKAVGVLAKTNPLLFMATAIAVVSLALVELYKHNAKFRAFVNNMVKSCKEFYNGAIKWFQKTGKDITKIFTGVIKWFKSNWKEVGLLIVNPIAGAFTLIYKNNKGFRNFCNTLIKDAENMSKNVVKWFQNLGKGIVNACSNAWKTTKKAFSDGWKDVTNGVKAGTKDVGDKWNSLKNTVGSHVNSMWKTTKNTFSDGWKDTKNLVNDGRNKVANMFDSMRKVTNNTVSTMWKYNKATFQDGYKVTQDNTQTWHDVMTGKWGKVGSDLKNTTNDLVRFWKSAFKGVYDWLNGITGGRLGDVLNTFKSVFDKIKGVVSGAVTAVHDAFTDIVRGIIKPFDEMLGGLKKGINWVLDKVGATQIKASWNIPLPAYAQGTKDTHQGGLALVNDAKGANYREMYHTPDGQVGMFPAQRDMIVNLPKGTSVLNGEASAKMASMFNLPSYASGIGSFFSGLWNKGKDLLEDADKIIAHPIQFLESVFKKFTSSISAGAGLASDIITNFPSTIAKSATNWIKNLFSEDAGGSSANPSGSGVQRWKDDVIKALRANGLSTSSGMVAKVLRQIATESSGNPHAIQGNIGDINNKTGDLAKGLMQTISTTFNANAFPGHHNIFNGYDNLLAALHYAKKRYGSSLSFLGNGHGYENGGVISQHGMYEIAEKNKAEMVLPLTDRSRASQLLASIGAKFSGDSTNSSSSNSDVTELSSKLDTLTTMFGTLLTLVGENVQATQNIGDKKARYTQMAKDMGIASYQAV